MAADHGENSLNETPHHRRPGPTIAAGVLLASGGALFAAEVLLSGDRYFTDMTTYEQAIRDGIVENDTAFAAVGAALHLTMTVIGVFVGAALVVLALFTAFGQGWARAVSWLFGLPVLIWYGILAVLYFLAGALGGSVADTEPDPAELTRRLEEAWPPWRNTLDVVLMVLVAVLLVAALVLQTAPGAGARFRRRGARA